MKVFVVGATGVLGKNVIPRLLERGHNVVAVARRPDAVDRLSRLGVDAHVGDILDIDSLREPVRGCDAALHLATAIPKSQEPDAFVLNDRIRREGTRNLIDVCEDAGVRRYVQQSITFLYGECGDDIVDESATVNGEGRRASAAEMEATVKASKLDWCILRGGAFYGPTTTAERRWRERTVDGSLKLPGDGSGWVSLVHEVDFSRAVVLAAEMASPRSIYNVVDDVPVRFRDLFAHIANLAGVDTPGDGGTMAGLGPPVSSLAVSNARIKSELGWAPVYPSYRSGIIS